MPVPVIRVAQMRGWEKATWASGQTEGAVIQCAGRAVARFVEMLTCAGDGVLVLAGKGHNGDDAKYAAKFVSERNARVLEVLDPEGTIKEFKAALKTPVAL